MRIYLIGLAVKILGIIIPPLLGVAFLVPAERKVTASMQRRRGPNVVGILGLLQPPADGLKLMIKEPILPSSANISTPPMAPVPTSTLASRARAVIPFDYGTVFPDPNVGVLHLFAIPPPGVYGIITAGWASNPKYAFSGASRSAAQMVPHEVSIGLLLISVILCAGSCNFSEIVLAQTRIWFVLPPFPVFLMFSIPRSAETNRAPLDLPEAEAEPVAGYNVEYPPMGFALSSSGEYANMILMSSLRTLLFPGGWLPILDIPIFQVISGSIRFSIKVPLFPFVYIRVRAAFPRYRHDQLMRPGRKVFSPLSLAWVVLASGVPVAFEWLP